MFSRSIKVLNSKEDYFYRKEYALRIRDYLENPGEEQRGTPGCSILDSTLISQTKLTKFDVKVVQCGDYKQIYFFNKTRVKRIKENEKIEDLNFLESKLKRKNLINKMFDDLDLHNIDSKEKGSLKQIEEKNINRSRIEMQRLLKSNIDDFKTFITLTFDSSKVEIDINDIKEANKKFNTWKTYIRRLFPNFKYIAVPEFQKRGAVHYHLVTNLEYDSPILSKEERKIWNKTSKSWHIGKDVKGWKYGYSMAKNLSGINVVGYLSKYMTKDIDNRLFGKHRYFYSYNLKKPRESFLSFDNEMDMLYYLKSLNDMELAFERKYLDKFGEEVLFLEYSKVKKLT